MNQLHAQVIDLAKQHADELPAELKAAVEKLQEQETAALENLPLSVREIGAALAAFSDEGADVEEVNACIDRHVPYIGRCAQLWPSTHETAGVIEAVESLVGLLQNADGGRSQVAPPASVCETVNELERALAAEPTKPPELRPLEGVDVLAEQGLTHKQIGKNYGLSEEQVKEELLKPGTWVNDTWVDPRLSMFARANAETVRPCTPNIDYAVAMEDAKLVREANLQNRERCSGVVPIHDTLPFDQERVEKARAELAEMNAD